ncbi:MAG: 2-C-methyl-D-erythritol 4-phosphate cytidylyltransferase [Bacillota bacterium]|nr:2-C-methyl-D-erythritol 4-phosphate cytidylyltransferase [Bacillota bacterium]
MISYAVLLCAGRGKRMGEACNKLFLPLCGKPVLWHSIKLMLGCEFFDGMVMACAREDMKQCEKILSEFDSPFPVIIIEGGKERQESAKNALAALPEGVEAVLIHDAARPFTEKKVMKKCLEMAAEHGACIAATPSKDTVKMVKGGEIKGTPDRSSIWLAQTPQAFRTEVIINAHREAEENGISGTDDAQLVEACGGAVKVVESSWGNIKITTPEDMAYARAILNLTRGGNAMRIGTGYDAHKLAEGRPLIIGGAAIPFESGLLGHSDADVLTHAVMDALLGAANLGDIGLLFPDTDKQYEGISSIELLKMTGKNLKRQGYAVINIDATVVAQRPRLRPYTDEMAKNMAKALDISPEAVSIKATTTEGMGFEGRQEGISAHAVACIESI